MVETTDQAAAPGDHEHRTAVEAKPIRVGRNPFGFWFWLPVIWLGFVVFCALSADLLPLPAQRRRILVRSPNPSKISSIPR